MAGIAGIWVKKASVSSNIYRNAFRAMIQKLAFNDQQLRNTFMDGKLYFGNVVPDFSQKNINYQFSEKFDIHCVIDGLVFINKIEKKIISDNYGIRNTSSDYELMPYMFAYYDTDIVFHITGWYNIFILNKAEQRAILFNDRLGYSPLYYYDSNTIFLFASKIESLLASGLIPKIEFDATTIAEHLFFNYALSDQTYIRNISTLNNASLLIINDEKASVAKYWSMAKLYNSITADRAESFELMNSGLNTAMEKLYTFPLEKFNVSFTGGWDSRVVLSYLLPKFKNKFHFYSFGAKNADDILIPHSISEKEGLEYTAFVLDQKYLEDQFIPFAIKTINLSNGTRNYKRAHYLFAVQKISQISNMLISGIFGDEVFKIGRPAGGSVLSQNTIRFIESNFDVDKLVSLISKDPRLRFLNYDANFIIDELKARLLLLKKNLSEYDTIVQKYYSFRFELNLRKYFGNEINSYNDFAFSFSPFIDYDFLQSYSQTKYFGIQYPFSANNIKLKYQSAHLYYDIIRTNYSPLLKFTSARGYSVKDVVTINGFFRIIFNKYIKKSNFNIDAFNTKTTDLLFFNLLREVKSNKENVLSFVNLPCNVSNVSDINSLYYWLSNISDHYL